MALRSEQNWTGKYVLDFEQLLKEHHAPGKCCGVCFFLRGLIFFLYKNAEQAAQSGNECDEDEGENDPDRPAFSLVTGTYRHAKRYGEGENFFASSRIYSGANLYVNFHRIIT